MITSTMLVLVVLVGTPMFTLSYQREPISLGVGASSDGFNMGLIPPVITGTAEIPMAQP